MKPYLLLCLITLMCTYDAISQSQLRSNEQQIVETYNPTHLNYHHYQYISKLCIVDKQKGRTIETVFKLFTSNVQFAAPAYKPEPVENYGVYFLMLSLPGINLPGLHPIKIKVSPANHIVINYTLPGHALHPGMVERKIIQVDDTLFLLTTGTGYSDINQFFSSPGLCTGLSPLLLKSATFLANKLSDYLSEYAKSLNKRDCVVANTWEPVDNFFRLELKNKFAYKTPDNQNEPILNGVLQLFKGVKNHLSIKDKIDIYKKCKFHLSANGKDFIEEDENEDVPDAHFDVHVEAVDLNNDGIEEVFIHWGNLFTSGNVAVNVTLFVKRNGIYESNLGFGGMALITNRNNNGYPDLIIGGPGFTSPVWRWNGMKYFFYKSLNQSSAEYKSLKLTYLNSIKNF